MLGKKKTPVFLLIPALLLCACASRPLKCNIHVIELMDKRGVYLPNTDANGLDAYLKKSSKWQQIPKLKNGKLNHKAAYEAAKARKGTVLAAYNSGAKNNGHIVMVYGKKKMVWSKNFGANVPFVSGSVQGKKAKITPLSNQFSPNKEARMNYYIYKK